MQIIRYAKLPVTYNVKAMRAELLRAGANWLSHLNTYHYTGSWTVLALRSPGGRCDNPVPDLLGDDKEFKDTEHLASFPSVKQLLDGLQCPVYAARFLKLKAGSVIKKHRDNELAFEKGEARLHFPVITNPLVEFCSEDERIPLLEGECWYLNANLPHSVANHGETDRVHLVVDCEVNNWLTGLMKAATQVAKKNTVDTSQTLNTIAMLRLQNTTTANDLANALEKELEAAEDEN